MPILDLFDQLALAGLIRGSHESDLYVADVPAAWAILDGHPAEKGIAKPFTATDGSGLRLLDLPFCNAAFWRARGHAPLPAAPEPALAGDLPSLAPTVERIMRAAFVKAFLDGIQAGALSGFVGAHGWEARAEEEWQGNREALLRKVAAAEPEAPQEFTVMWWPEAGGEEQTTIDHITVPAGTDTSGWSSDHWLIEAMKQGDHAEDDEEALNMASEAILDAVFEGHLKSLAP